MQSTSVLPVRVGRTTGSTQKSWIWVAVAGSSVSLLGLFLLFDQGFNTGVGNAWALVTLLFAVGLLVEAFQAHDKGIWESITSIPFAIGTFMLTTLVCTFFPFDAGLLWPAFIIAAALPTLRT